VAVAAPRLTGAELEELRLGFREDFPFYAETCLRIVDKSARLVPFELNEPQLAFWREIKGQRDAGKPVRAIILKARKIGFSTETQGILIQRCTQRPYRRGLVVAQDRNTAGELFGIGHRMYNNLPVDLPVPVKPPQANKHRGRFMSWGEPSRTLQGMGDMGLDSSLLVDTANEVEAGRGFTFTDVHLSEVAFWADPMKMTSILNAVPDDPETTIIVESTANGANFFKGMWDRAERGESEYVAFFAAWWRDPTCTRGFAQARAEDEPAEGELIVKETVKSKGRMGEVDVPTAIDWRPRAMGRAHNVPFWRVWEQPDPAGDYVVALDPMGGDVTEEGELAFHGLVVIDHRTGAQVAEWMARMDTGLAVFEGFKAALLYNRAWYAIETTGGYGTEHAKRVHQDFKYDMTYRRRQPTMLHERTQKKLGWDTNRETKPMLEEAFEEQLREGTHGIRSERLALQLSTYVRDLETGKTGPAAGAFSDLLMAYMIAQQVRREMPIKRRAADGSVLGPRGPRGGVAQR
jgi:hypothetical protein